MSGRGVGVAGALFAAIDAAQKTWEEGGLWRRPTVRLYTWRLPLLAAAALALVGAAILAVPLLVLAAGLIAYPIGFLVQMIDADAGRRVATGYATFVASAFEPLALPTLIPRLVTLVAAAIAVVLAVSALLPIEGRRRRPAHRTRGFWWARATGVPWSAAPGVAHFQAGLWEVFRGPINAKAPGPAELSRRYLELLAENLGQPGFRELVVTALDLETRGDLIFAVLGEERRPAYFHRGSGEAAPHPRPERPGDLVDLAGVGRDQALDALAGAMAVALMTEPHLLAFSPESYWKGETHRICDRPAAVSRLLHELAVAGVEQVIVVSAAAERTAPHRLNRPYGTLHARLTDDLAAEEASAVRDGVATQSARFRGVFLIQPGHNPVGPFDFKGAYDERSDRFQSVEELVDRGYEDAYRQFIEPIVGSEGDDMESKKLKVKSKK
ncbi:MAG TPA: hypothetical protein VGZ27_14840 [Vicinamibacterales bacterium]|jgi:hypothetical protein|nr:hypothetical protein [Vicinamibacterales bacterium]